MEITFDGGKVITAHFNGHTIKTDLPEKSGGKNLAPAPYELFLASIGTCAGIYVKSFCDQRNIPAEQIKIIQTIEYDSITNLPSDIIIDIQLPNDFPDKYKEAIIKAAENCKVKKTLANPPEFKIITTKI